MHALHYANELLVRVRFSVQKLLQNRSTYRNNTKKMFGKSVLVADKSTDHDKPYFDFYVFMFLTTTISTSKKMFTFRARADQGIVRHIGESGVVST